MSLLLHTVQQKAKDIKEEVRENRRHLHAHPELSFQEYETSAFVAKKLDDLGIEQSQVADTGVVGLIKGKNPDKGCIALRADMDALPIVEANQVPYASTKPGVMHACGHDVHTASLLGAAKILQEVKNEFEGTIKLLFQPGEEKIPGGASLMIKDGALVNPTPARIVGQHVMPFIPCGQVGFRKGIYMASADEIYMKVRGKGGHAAMPDRNIDPVLITSHILVALQQLVSRHVDPKLPMVLSFGKVMAQGATNVIPDVVEVEGTMRTLNETWRFEAHKRIIKMAKGIAEGMGGSVDVDIKVGYPYLENDPLVTATAQLAAYEFMGEENVVDLDIWMAAEDFAFYSHQVPASFYRLGTQNIEKGIVSSVHTPTFDIDEEALETGAGLMAWIALKQLEAL